MQDKPNRLTIQRLVGLTHQAVALMILFGALMVLPGCSQPAPAATLLDSTPTLPPSSATPSPSPTLAASPTAASSPTALPSPTPTIQPTLRVLEEWKSWPVIPVVSASAAAIYQRGLEQGNDPHVFAILGDCQSLPETFMGIYDTDSELTTRLPQALQETVAYFSGSFSRRGATIKEGTTAAALLWFAWHEDKYGCLPNETPLDCELRQVKPSIVFINIGTHYETRNIIYLRKVIDTLIAHGSLPILATKADNRELDDRLNLEMAQLALEYDLPLWNFYAAVSDMPENGVSLKAGEEHLGVIYLVPEALERHRFTALQALDAVWRAVKK